MGQSFDIPYGFRVSRKKIDLAILGSKQNEPCNFSSVTSCLDVKFLTSSISKKFKTAKIKHIFVCFQTFWKFLKSKNCNKLLRFLDKPSCPSECQISESKNKQKQKEANRFRMLVNLEDLWRKMLVICL